MLIKKDKPKQVYRKKAKPIEKNKVTQAPTAEHSVTENLKTETQTPVAEKTGVKQKTSKSGRKVKK